MNALILLPPHLLLRRFERWVASLRAFERPPLTIELWNGQRFPLTPVDRVLLRLNQPRALQALIKPTLAGMGEAYVQGLIDVEGAPQDVIQVAERLCQPQEATGGRRRLRRARHTQRQDAQAIAHHYDVSNEFYRAWLDERMVYSCAYFKSAEDSLETAQTQKLDHILGKIRLQPGERLLDIGCGWGALVMRAAAQFGARALGITLSRRQFDLAQVRIQAAGLQDRCEVRMQDYREVRGQFERITSVGMFEHVGLNNLYAYFRKIHDLLTDQGLALNHGITSTDPDSRETPHGGGEFIHRHVFPQGELPHLSLVLKEMAAAGLEALDVENLRRHYALTLRHWSARFEAAGKNLASMVGERRYRVWRMYLAGCAHGFEQNWIALQQVLVCKADIAHTPADIPLTRDYMYVRNV